MLSSSDLSSVLSECSSFITLYSELTSCHNIAMEESGSGQKFCLKWNQYSSNLAAHRRVHEGRVHRCTFDGCQYWTPKGTLLKAHIRAHNGDKCFKCETCGKVWTT